MKAPHMHDREPQGNEPRQQHDQPRYYENLPFRLTRICLFVLAAVQLGLLLHNLGGFTQYDSIGGLLQVIAVCGLSVVEMFMLASADVLWHASRNKLAVVWRTVFGCVVALTLFLEFGAMQTVASRDQAHRAQATFEYTEQQKQLATADAEIAKLRGALSDPERPRPPAAISASLKERRELREPYEARGEIAPAWLRRQIARLESDLAIANEIERQKQLRDQASNWLTTQDAQPRAHHPMFEGIAKLLTWAGMPTTPDGAQVGLAFGLVLILKLVLTIGFMVVSAPAVVGGGGSSRRSRWRWQNWEFWPFGTPKTVLPEIEQRYRGTSDLPKVGRAEPKPPKQSPRRTDRRGPIGDDDLDDDINDLDPDNPDDPDDKKNRGGGGWLH